MLRRTRQAKPMKRHPTPKNPKKLSSGIDGFDEVTAGGLPQGRITLLIGGPGCGKTVFALQALTRGAALDGTAGIFVAFEENVNNVQSNAATFDWNITGPARKLLYFVDGQIRPDTLKAGGFDLTALLAGLEAKAQEIGAKLIVFDALDILIGLLDDPAAERRELYRIQAWLMRTGLTGILTAKVEEGEPTVTSRTSAMAFMADCVVLLRQRVFERAALREMRVVKYRGSPHLLDEVPFVIGTSGIEVGNANGVHAEPQPFQDRVSTGVARLDQMLHGGVYRGTNALITGSAGTGKSTLSGLFIESACRRGERALFISFDENALDIIRDLASVSVDLTPHLKSGLLRLEAVRTEAAASEDHLARIKALIREHRPTCLAVDPFSALVNVGGEVPARHALERLIHLCRNERITVFLTSLLEGRDAAMETTPLHISTLADTWMQISYSLFGGERNRALTIIKSRGSKHSNQMRELIFSDTGITLADPYTAGGEVLMGTLRIEKENAVRAERENLRDEMEQKRREIELVEFDRDARVRTARGDLQKLEHLTRTNNALAREGGLRQDEAVRSRDRKLVHEQVDGTKPNPGKTRARAKAEKPQ